MYQCNVCGEGGEYESLVLDCPLFKHARIVLDQWDVVLHSPDIFAPVGLLQPTAFHLESKTAASHPQQPTALLLETDTGASDWQPSTVSHLSHLERDTGGSDAQQAPDTAQPSDAAGNQHSDLHSIFAVGPQHSNTMQQPTPLPAGHSDVCQQLPHNLKASSLVKSKVIEVPRDFPTAVHSTPDASVATSSPALMKQDRPPEQQPSGNAESGNEQQECGELQREQRLKSASTGKKLTSLSGSAAAAVMSGTANACSVNHASTVDCVPPDGNEIQLDMQLQHGEHYTWVVCSASSSSCAEAELSSQSTAEALESALQAITTGVLVHVVHCNTHSMTSTWWSRCYTCSPSFWFQV